VVLAARRRPPRQAPQVRRPRAGHLRRLRPAPRHLRRLLPDLGLAGHGYHVTAFVYATCAVAVPHWLERPEGHANWIGYVAVAGAAEARRAGYREIVVAWWGTISAREWLLDMKTEMVPFNASGKADHGGAAMVAKGFHSIYTSRNAGIKRGGSSAPEQVAGEVARLAGHFRGEEVRVAVTGHSLGGALALLTARDVAAAHPDVPVAAVTFSAPRVGNSAFRDGLVSRAGVSVLRVVVRLDVVATVPSVSKAPVVDAPLSRPLEKLWGRVGWSPEWAYVHVGDVLELDVTESPFLKHKYDPVGSHSLETCLHLLAGRESAAEEFRLDVNGRACRDVALASKTSNILRDELANCKGLRNKLGMWMLVMGKLEEEDDLPVQDDRLPLSELD
jgi:hypothetical protein